METAALMTGLRNDNVLERERESVREEKNL